MRKLILKRPMLEAYNDAFDPLHQYAIVPIVGIFFSRGILHEDGQEIRLWRFNFYFRWLRAVLEVEQRIGFLKE